MTNWLPMICPACDHQDQMDAADYDNGLRLQCENCGEAMRPLNQSETHNHE